jgi:lipoprotein-anchoring transpeptidase ErfK/SrfK
MRFTIDNLRRCPIATIVGVILAVNLGLSLGAAFAQQNNFAYSRDDDQAIGRLSEEATDNSAELISPELRRHVVRYEGREAPGTIVIDTPNTYLYYVLGNGQAIRYGIGVGREGFTWSGVRAIDRKTEWPDWIPPAEMIDRQPDLPRWMAGGPGNPLGARAMYLGGTLYRIHGTSEPATIGQRVSSGCIRMLNEDVIDLFGRVPIGTKVVVLPDTGRRMASRIQNEPQLSGPRTPASIYGPSVAREPSAMSVFSPLSLY